MTSRAEFLGRIRREMAKTSGLFPATVAERAPAPREIVAAVRRQLAERWPAALERFATEFERVGGVLHRVDRRGAVAGVIGRLARERQARAIVTWPPEGLGTDLGAELRAEGLTVDVMPAGEGADGDGLRRLVAAADLGLTAVDLAIAETGTLVLRSGPGRPRSTSLLPPCHIALFDRTALVESLAQVSAFLESWHDGSEPATMDGAITFITGPSRTADIELTLTRGVHGPGEVHAVFVDGGIGG